ncbi:MAG: LamG-like jellyroll fold domain-containing protein [Patescibacteria group bacterium]|nr:LamG-like jellyroll fold domain-containing protein [Patescibacteria group bacterium]
MCRALTLRIGSLFAFVILLSPVAESRAAVLLGYWKMEENQTKQRVVDSSANGLLGAYVSTLNPSVYGPQGFGLATDFRNTTATIALADAGFALSSLTNDFSVMAWINAESIDVLQRFISNSTWGFAVDGGGVANDLGQLRFTTYGAKDYRSSEGVLPEGTWAHVAAVINGNNDVAFYVNGNAVGVDTHGSSGTAGSSVTYIGGRSSSDYFAGLVDEVAVFNGTLTQSQIQQYMNSGVPTPKQTVFRYDYDSSEPLQTIPDDSGANHPATAATGTVYSENTPWPNGFATSLLPGGLPKGTGDRSVDTSAGGIVTDAVNLINSTLIAAAGGFTLETWVYRLQDANSASLEKIIDVGGVYRLQLASNADSTGDADTVRFNYANGSATLHLGEWHHIAAVVDTLGNQIDGNGDLAAVARFFFDGQQMGTDASMTLTASNDTSWLQTRGIGIGRHPTGSELFQGLLYDTRVTLGALSPGEFLLIPEPSSLILLAIGLVGLAVGRRNRTHRSRM